MLVLCTVIYIEVVEDTTTERALGEHTLYGVTDNLIHAIFALAQLSGCVEALATGVTSITCVNLVSFFLASENRLSGIDDDDIVSTVYMRSECGFVLSAEQLGYF